MAFGDAGGEWLVVGLGEARDDVDVRRGGGQLAGAVCYGDTNAVFTTSRGSRSHRSLPLCARQPGPAAMMERGVFGRVEVRPGVAAVARGASWRSR